MKPLRGILACSATLFALLSPLSAADAPAPAKKPESFILVDFRNAPNPYGYGSFSNLVGSTKDGILVAKAPSGKGGCCYDANLKLEDAKWLEVGLATLPFNEAPALQVMFEDADGTNASFRFNIQQLVPGSPVWLRIPVKEAQIVKGGSNGVLDGDAITKWHVQGDWATEKVAQFLVIALRARR